MRNTIVPEIRFLPLWAFAGGLGVPAVKSTGICD